METLIAALFVLVVVTIFAGVSTLAIMAARRTWRPRGERDALVALAHQRGWTYQHTDTGSADRFRGAEPFPRHSFNLAVSDLVAGTFHGRRFCCFEYRRRAPRQGRRGTAQQRRYEYFRVFAVVTPAAGPRLQVRRAGLGGKLLDRLGAGGLELGDPEFDREFRVTGEDERFARGVLTDGLRRWLLDDPRSRDLPLRIERDELITWQRGRLTAPTVEPALDHLNDVLDRVPASVWPARS